MIVKPFDSPRLLGGIGGADACFTLEIAPGRFTKTA
jgi:hypothetical protein